MKKLFVILCALISMSAAVQGQVACNSICSPCTKPTVDTVYVIGSTLTVGWDNYWFWSNTQCSKGTTILVNGVEYGANGPFTIGDQIDDNAASSRPVAGYTAVAGTSVCVVVRNYCSAPYTCDPTNYVDSDPYCIFVPNVPPVVIVDCLCPNGQYKVTKGNAYKCVTQPSCLKWVAKGWTSACNCQ
jgi:hypothetical protein